MGHHPGFLRVAIYASGVLCIFGRATAGELINPQKLLDVVRTHEAAFEARVRTAQWKGGYARGKLIDRSRLDSFRPIVGPNEFGRCTITFEPPTGRYRVDVEQVSKWVGGPEEYAGVVRSYSNDGITQRRFHRSHGGTKLPPPNTPGTGLIVHPEIERFLRAECGSEGLGYFPPHFNNRRFSTFIEERISAKSLFRVEQRADRMWWIETLGDPGSDSGPKEDLFVVYDPVRGLVHSQEIYCKSDFPTDIAGINWAGKLVRLRRVK